MGVVVAGRQGHDNQVSGFTRRHAAGFVGPSERLGAGQRGHAQQYGAGHIRIKAAQKTDFRKHVKIGVGREAISADGDAHAAREKFPKRMRRMAEGGVGAGAVDDTGVGRNRGGWTEEVAVNNKRRR